MVTQEVLIKLFRGILNINVWGKQAEIASFQQNNRRIRKRIEGLEQMIRLIMIKIHRVPESEQRMDTNNIVIKFAKEKLGNNISKTVIILSNRISRPHADKPRAIIVDFINHNLKTSLITNDKTLKTTPLSINQGMTKYRSKLVSVPGVLQRNSKLKQTWTRDGMRYIKLNDDSIITINT